MTTINAPRPAGLRAVGLGLRVAARLVTGSTYLVLGLDAVRAPGARVDQAKPMLATLRRFVPLPVADETVVRGNAAAQTVSGALLALGVFPEVAAATLVGSLVPTTIAGHPFWALDDPMERKLQRIQFHKNLAMIGGLLFAMAGHHRLARHVD